MLKAKVYRYGATFELGSSAFLVVDLVSAVVPEAPVAYLLIGPPVGIVPNVDD